MTKRINVTGAYLWKLEAEKKAFQNKLTSIHESLRNLLNLKLGMPENIDFKSNDGYEEGDEDEPFFSELYLYNLLGKGDARSVLDSVEQVVHSCGIDMYSQQEKDGTK